MTPLGRHIFKSLENSGIFTFQDDKRLEHGVSISYELLKAIEQSQVALVVFSKNYATSMWCLDELVKIMECKDQFGQTVIPVFYDVDPSHVRKQRESFAEAFDKHKTSYKDDDEGMQKLQRWRNALTAAANLKGYDVRDRIEVEIIQQIVDQISKLLNSATFSSLQDVVGIDTHLEKLKSLLKVGTNDIRIILGVWGMGGVGKTTIARAIFDILFRQFEAACFLADIKENEKLHSLQNTLLSELLRRKDVYVSNKHDGKRMISDRLCSKKVLIVLDDIGHKDHLEYLVGDIGWFGNGSRVIVITRDKNLIGKDGAMYEVTALPDHESIQLFHQHAFGKEVPDECFKDLSLKVVNYAKGLPLALKVWGSSLHKRDISVWRSALEQMKINLDSEIVEKLKISYDGLEPIHQEMFLDIACFLRGEEKNYTIQVLESCYSGVEYGLNVLIDKSLVFISKKGEFQMHDLIQEMGKYIVNLQKNPGERSRLWLVKDLNEVMTNNTGTMAMEAIWVSSCYSRTLHPNNEAMKNMKRLTILYITGWGSLLHNLGSIEYLSNNLRWFVWDYYPWESLPSTFEPKMLVHLQLKYSSLHYLWMETKHLPSLRRIDLSFSKGLMQTPDFTGMPNLECLKLYGCCNLKEVHHSLGCCNKLILLDLSCCSLLKRFPCVNVESLEYLNLTNCYHLEKFPYIQGTMKREIQIHMQFSGLRELPSSIFQYQTHITRLSLLTWGMNNLVALPSCICRLKSLVILNVLGCSKLESLPEDIGDLENLEELDASSTLISRLPSSIVRLNKLKILKVSTYRLGVRHGVHFEFPHVAEGLHSLEHLDLSYCNLIDGGLPEDIGSLSSLKMLNLSENNFEHLPPSIAQLSALRILNLRYCRRLTQLPELPLELNELHVDCHTAMKSIHDLVTKRKKLKVSMI